MSGKETMKSLRKKMINIPDISNITFKKKIIYNNKILSPNNLKDDDFICEYSSELLNENIKLSGIIPPFINPIPCFTVKNDNAKKKISSRGTFFKNIKTQENLNNKENNNKNNIDNNEFDLKENSKYVNKNLNKSHINNRYFRAYSPYLDKKQNKMFKSENLESMNNTYKNNTNIINYEKMLYIKNKLINDDKIKLNNKKHILSCKKKYNIKSHLYYSTDNCYDNSPFSAFLKHEKKIKEEEKKNKKIALLKSLGQKINTATMNIELLQSKKKNKDLNSIKKKIEYNKIYCNNDLQRLKDNYANNINQHLNQIKYLKMILLKSEENFITINKHKNIINKEELDFKIKKMDLIEKIFSLKKKIIDYLSPDSTNDTYRIDDSYEEKTINDMSLNDYSILKDNISKGGNYSYNYNYKFDNKTFFNDKHLYESKIIKINKEINVFPAKFIKNMKEQNKKK